MTKKERYYLRSAYYHFDDIFNDTDQSAFNLITHSNIFRQITLLVLSLESDEDGDVEERLNDIFIERNIKFLE